MRGSTEPIGAIQLPPLVALAHELKAPLSLIRQLAMSRDYYTNEREYQRALRRVELVAERSLRLAEALTQSYRADQFHTEPVNLGRLCEEIAHELEPFCRESQQNIEVSIPKQPLLVVGNRDLLGSVIFGLCDNALSYAQENQPVILKAKRDGEAARVSIIDKGPGLARSEIKKIKARLGRAPQAIGTRPGSSGLGLYIAGQFAEIMDGRLGMRQSSGGQTFYINVPRSTQLSLLPV